MYILLKDRRYVFGNSVPFKSKIHENLVETAPFRVNISISSATYKERTEVVEVFGTSWRFSGPNENSRTEIRINLPSKTGSKRP